jgi:lipopolysaccharide export system protein LptA
MSRRLQRLIRRLFATGSLGTMLLAVALLTAAAPEAAAQLLQGGGDDQVPITVEADQGIEWIRDSKTYVARGNARATRADTRVTADTLTARYREKPDGTTEIYRLEADGNVVIATPRERALGDRGVYELDKASVVLTGRNLRFENGADVITARDSLEYWQEKRVAVARGDATAVRGTQRIAADTLTAHFVELKNGTTELSRIDADGNVVITTPEEVARGREGVYTAAKGTATLTGDVRITRGRNQLNGERAVVNLNTGISRLLPAGKGGERVKGLFTPGTAPQ